MTDPAFRHCTRPGCIRAGEIAPALRFWAEGRPKVAGQSATVFLPLWFCRPHAVEVRIDDLVDDDGWCMIADELAARGRGRPDRASLELEWRLSPPAAALS